jgi:hypothetical protein
MSQKHHRPDDPQDTAMPPLVHIGRDPAGPILDFDLPKLRSYAVHATEASSPVSRSRATQKEISVFEYHCKYSFMRSHLSRLLE